MRPNVGSAVWTESQIFDWQLHALGCLPIDDGVAFKTHLADYHSPNDVTEAYATTFYHGGKFLLVKTDAERAEQAMKILRECGPTRVNQPEYLHSSQQYEV